MLEVRDGGARVVIEVADVVIRRLDRRLVARDDLVIGQQLDERLQVLALTSP